MSMSSGNKERYSHTKTLSILFHRLMAGSDKAAVSSYTINVLQYELPVTEL